MDGASPPRIPSPPSPSSPTISPSQTIVFRVSSFGRRASTPVTSSVAADTTGNRISGPLVRHNYREEILRRFSAPAAIEDVGKGSQDVQFSKSQAAYHRVVDSLRVCLKKDEADALLAPTNGIRDLQQVAANVQQTRSTVVDKGLIRDFVKSLDHYQGVFDVLSQADFSGLPLVWGGIKFLLIISKNHITMLSEVMDMIVKIGNSLERIQVIAELYPTRRMIRFTDELYAALVAFLEKVIKNLSQNSFRRRVTSFWRSFSAEYGDLAENISRVQAEIMQDATVCQHITTMTTSHSLALYQETLGLQRKQMEQGLRGMAEDPSAFIFQDIRDALFRGFELEAAYHEELENTYKVTTSAAWVKWFKQEQKHLPSGFTGTTGLEQALCDAPDPQHALVWKAQQRKFASHIPSTYLIWTRGMTAQSAVASLLYQVVLQKPDVVTRAGLDMTAFASANGSIKELWDLFLHLIRVLGGCMVYLSICSVGDEEFAIVRKFVTMVRKWDGPPIKVTLIHPFHDNFARGDLVINLDEKYDVHPSLTTTDAIHHVMLLELNVHKQVSDTVRSLLWETAWREVRYAVIGIALREVRKNILLAAKEIAPSAAAGQVPGEQQTGSQTGGSRSRSTPQVATDLRAQWFQEIESWTADEWSMNTIREQIQRHIDIVDIHLPENFKTRLAKKLRLVVFSQDEEVQSRPLTKTERKAIWTKLQDAIRPGVEEMFCSGVRGLIVELLDCFAKSTVDEEGESTRQAFIPLTDMLFGKDGKWKTTFSLEADLIEEGVLDAIEIGFEEIIEMLAEDGPED